MYAYFKMMRQPEREKIHYVSNKKDENYDCQLTVRPPPVLFDDNSRLIIIRIVQFGWLIYLYVYMYIGRYSVLFIPKITR